MANIVLLSDFVGEININSANQNIQTILNNTISQREAFYIKKMFGKYSVKWVYDHVYVPETEEDGAVNPDYQLFYDGGNFTDTDGNTITFKGIKTILAYFLYSDLLTSEEYLNTSMGNIVTKERASTYSLTYQNTDSIVKKVNIFNKAIEMYEMLCEYMLLNETLFPDNFELTELEYANIYGI